MSIQAAPDAVFASWTRWQFAARDSTPPTLVDYQSGAVGSPSEVASQVWIGNVDAVMCNEWLVTVKAHSTIF